MKLPRWLSPVRTVEAATGWRPSLCRRVARERHVDWLVIVWSIYIVLLAGPALVGLAVVLLNPESDDGWDQFVAYILFLNLVGSFAIMTVLSLIVLAVRTSRVCRMLPRFMAAPWCLKCQYPVSTSGGRGSICPECGEPIPPEIAKLVAERAGHSGRTRRGAVASDFDSCSDSCP